MSSYDTDTIYALATPAGKGGLAVIRVSGSGALESLKALTQKARGDFDPRRAVLSHIYEPQSGIAIDQALVTYFKGPASFTGEDVAEYYLHGGVAIVKAVLSSLASLPHHRMAEPGEFTRRAFENGKLDLTAAEAVADLIDAETELQRAQALGQLEGSLSQVYEDWASRLTKYLAHLEADIEFPDEDMPDGIAPEVIESLQNLLDEVRHHLDDGRRGERLRDGLHVAVIGAPNAGKSSIVNALAQRDIAIVSDMAGTTRDVIEVHLDLGGYPVILSDTAGLRPEQLGDTGHDAVESEGIKRAIARAQRADVKMLVFDAGVLPEKDSHTWALQDEKSLVVWNKSDLCPQQDEAGLYVSATTQDGFPALMKALTSVLDQQIGRRETPSLTRERHRQALEEVCQSLERALKVDMPELVAEDVRLSVRALGRITGRVHVEDLLDVIFGDFCIGK